MKKFLILSLVFVASCTTINYGNIDKDLVVISESKKKVENVEIENISLTNLSRKSLNILAASKTYQISFRREDLIKKAKELGASQIFIAEKTECAPRNVWGEFQGCWTYDLIYFAE